MWAEGLFRSLYLSSTGIVKTANEMIASDMTSPSVLNHQDLIITDSKQLFEPAQTRRCT
jgi:hypothetical protein